MSLARGDVTSARSTHTTASTVRAPRTAGLVGLYHAMGTLSGMPHRCPLAPETQTEGGTVRYLLYRDYRVVYEVIGRRVNVLHVQHSSLPLML